MNHIGLIYQKASHLYLDIAKGGVLYHSLPPETSPRLSHWQKFLENPPEAIPGVAQSSPSL